MRITWNELTVSLDGVDFDDLLSDWRWLVGEEPQAQTGQPEEAVNLQEPVPVFMTYFTVAPTSTGVAFRSDPYNRDGAVIRRFFGDQPEQMAAIGS